MADDNKPDYFDGIRSHFEETEIPQDKGGGTKQKPRKYEIEICRPPYCKGDKLDSRTMSKYA